ncbi:hypothetical protein [Streptomyces luteireticuli]|uniref:hypothetical protein n=1 Tax=Streptomyces luteireticuli TaxID=173858 RepID=UPI0031D134E5
MNSRIRDPIEQLLNPPGCRRAVKANVFVAANSWALLRFEPPGQGAGKASSFDSTGSMMSDSPTRVTAPLDGLYEVNAGLVMSAADLNGRMGYARAAVGKGLSEPARFDTEAFVKFGLNRITAGCRSGAGTATIPLRAGEWVSLAAWADASWVTADRRENAASASFLELSWVGDLP